MKEINHGASGIPGYGKQYGMTLGIVKNNADPAQQGRLQIYVPAYDANSFNVADLPWATYVSPFGGVTANFAVGPEGETLPGISAYGFWAIPKNSAQVLVGCIDGNPDNRFWVGCVYIPEHNRTLPAGIDGVTSEIDESGVYPQKDFPHAQEKLQKAGLWKGSTHFKTRGGYERSVSHPSNKNNNKPTDNGYAPKPLEPAKADSQAVSLTSPGRHMFVMSDVDEHCRIRLKTTNGSQIILDDTNERIYISTAEGKNYIELDEGNGKIYVYSDSKVSIRAKNDLNLYSDENINIVANKRVHIKSEERSVHVTAKCDVTLKSTNADVLIAASRDLKLKTFNGPQAGALGAETVQTSNPLDVIYRWPEKGGSGTSNIELDSAGKVQSVSQQGTLLTVRGSEGFNVKSSGSVNLQGPSVNLAFPSVNWQSGASMNLKDTDNNSTIVVTGGASSSSAYSGHKVLSVPYMGEMPQQGKAGGMVKPEHESWVRDEDSAFAKNEPRNFKYIG
jgi:hypothetical protein